MTRLLPRSSPFLRSALPRPSLLPRLLAAVTKPTPPPSRFISNLPPLRPTTLLHPGIFRAPTTATTTKTAAGGSEVVDVVPKTSITAHPALAGVGAQMRCGPRPTMSGATRLVQKRRHGFLSRIRTRNGRNTLKRRIGKGRKRLSA
ncbi:hypothetical protein B0T18DRAFT_486847 [Schizothecium vesticola]|uniref:Ribosomal protein L34 n=1 Tax=Schizothecium vesticola TaxID=314040 RepID=A0AA40KBF6_9PEZI|nr:hypothetical protein B0T18DRAFT_486847 [Schizothecium vesticola]